MKALVSIALWLVLAASAAAQTGVERVILPDDVRRVVVAGSTTWITAISPPRLMRLDGSTLTIVPLPPVVTGVPRDLTSTPGVLWIRTSSAIVRYEIASGAATILQSMTFAATDRIVVGPDGNLWFSRGTQLHRMTTGGNVLSQITLPFHVTDLAVTGAAIWAVGGPPNEFLGASRTVVRVALDGSTRTFTLPADVALAESGVANEVWVSGHLNGKLFRLDDEGNVLRSFLVPQHRSMGTAANGDIWLAGDSDEVHRIRDATRTTYLVPRQPACDPTERTDIAIGPDQRVRILEPLPPSAFVFLPCSSGLPPAAPPAVVTLDPAQLSGSAPVPLEPFADVPVASTLGLILLAVALAIAAAFVMHK